MLFDVDFLIHHRPLPSDKEQSVLVIHHPHLVRGQKFPASALIVGGVVSVSPTALSIAVQVDGLFPQQLRNIFMGRLLVSTEIEKLIMR
jgi:hypothetical protein